MDIINRKEWQIPSNIFLVAKNAQKSKETLFNELMTKVVLILSSIRNCFVFLITHIIDINFIALSLA